MVSCAIRPSLSSTSTWRSTLCPCQRRGASSCVRPGFSRRRGKVGCWHPQASSSCRTAQVRGTNVTRPMPLSLSRLSHGQPGVQAHPEIVQGTAELHHEIADARLPQPDPVFHNATTLHTAVDMLNPQSAVVEHLVGQVLLQGQFLTSGRFLWCDTVK